MSIRNRIAFTLVRWILWTRNAETIAVSWSILTDGLTDDCVTLHNALDTINPLSLDRLYLAADICRSKARRIRDAIRSLDQ